MLLRTYAPQFRNHTIKTKMASQNFAIVMTNGTNDALKCEIAVVTAFGLRKNGHNVTILMMGEAGTTAFTRRVLTCPTYLHCAQINIFWFTYWI